MTAALRTLLASLLACLPLLAQAAPPPVSLRSVASGLSQPLILAHAGDGSGRLFIGEKGGRIKILQSGVVLPTAFLDISGLISTSGERGLLGLAFDPQYATNRRFYVLYTRAADGALRVSSFLANAGNANIAVPASEQEILTIPHADADNHNGGHIAFGPDGFLYIATGDGGGGGDPNNNGQNTASRLGKLLRIAVTGALGYTVPASNPFVGQAGLATEIWAYGLRNPWRFSFDRTTGDLYIGDVGQGAVEEVNFQAAGAPGGRNYGWRIFEGNNCYNPPTSCSLANHTPPILTYGHNASGGQSITGGYVYRGPASDLLQGYYLYGDFVSTRIWAARFESGAWVTTVVAPPPNGIGGLSSFGEDEAGEIYAASYSNGQVFILEAPSSSSSVLAMVSGAQSAIESAGTVAVVVNRTGPPTAAVSVNYATANGTAMAGTHYTATSGTLNWAAGDGAPKTITVPVANNGVANATRTFTVTLASPVGAVLGIPVTTTVSLTDDDNTLQFTASTAIVSEASPTLVLTVARTGGLAESAAVNWSTANGSALAGSDFGTLGNAGAVSGTLTWAAGDGASKSISIPILNDTAIEGTKSFSVALSSPTGTGASLGSIATVAVTLNDDDSGLSFAQAAYSVIEHGPNIPVVVNRTGGATTAVTVTWTTANGTAIAGQDFATGGSPSQRSGTLSWAAGDTTSRNIVVGPALVAVPIINDAVLEGDETFTITLSNPTGGALLGSTPVTTVTIVDNENAIAIGTTTLAVGETGANGVLTLTRTGNASAAASVTFTTGNGTAMAGSDFVQTTGTVSWAAGDASPKTIAVGPVMVAAPSIRVLNDAMIEPPETFTVTLSAPAGAILGANKVATVTIDSDDRGVTMATASQSVSEAAGSVAVAVNRAGPATGAISVNYATANGTAVAGSHYSATTGTLNWPDGDVAPKLIAVPVLDNAAINSARTFSVTLSGAVGASMGMPMTTMVTIADDDNTVQFTSAVAAVTEGMASLTLSVSRLGGAAGAASVNWATADGTALSGSDFGTLGTPTPVSGTLNWAAADSASKLVVIPILNDALVEGAKTFTVNLSSPTGATVGTVATATVTLNDNDAGVVFASPSYVVNETGTSVTLTVNRIGPTTAAGSVTWTTANGSATSGADFGLLGNAAPRTGVLSWAANDAMAKTIVIPMLNDALAEGNETFTVTLSNPSASFVLGSPSLAAVTIADDETPPESTVQFSAPKFVVTEGTPTVVLTVTRTGSGYTFPVSVNYAMAAGTATATSDYTAATGPLSWASGDSAAKTITIPITNDAVAENPEQFTVTLSGVSAGTSLGTPSAATVSILDDDEAFPPDGHVPAGWGVPGGATQGWHVSNDAGAFEGVFSLKSDFIDDGQSAQVEVPSASYLAGNISFRVKVSSEPNFDVLRFYIDDIIVGAWSGTASTGWQMASFPVAAGVRTFRWSYEKDGSVSHGLDAAYLDAVVLPPKP